MFFWYKWNLYIFDPKSLIIYLVSLVAHLYIRSKHWEGKLCALLTVFACLTSYMKSAGFVFGDITILTVECCI